MARKDKRIEVHHHFDTVKETLGEDLEAATELRDEIQEQVTENQSEYGELIADLADAQGTVDRLQILYNAEP